MKKTKTIKTKKYLEQGLTHHQTGNLRDAAANYRKALKHDKRNPEALNLLGVVCLQTGAPEKAVSLISDALRQAPDNSGYLNNLGQALHATGKAGEAVISYQNALKIEPNNTDFLNNLGISMNLLGRYDAAKSAFESALLLNRNDPEIYHNFGNLLRETGEYTNAIDNFRSALQLNPSLPATHGSLASALEDSGHREQAEQSYLDAIKLDPFYQAAHLALKKIRWAARETDRLHDSYLYACEAHPNSATAFSNLTNSLFESDEFEAAFEAVNKALELDNEHAASYGVLSTLHRAQENYDAAIEAHKKAVNLDRNNYQSREAFGYTLSVAGRFKEAIPVLKEAHKMNPRRSSVLGGLTVAMNEVQDPKVDDFVNYDTYVTARLIDIPEGFEDLRGFNDALHDEIASRHDDRPPPMDQTMRGGTQIPDHLFNGATGLTAVVQQQIAKALGHYIEQLDDAPNHPFLRFKNPDFRFTGAWSTILYGDGYDGSHIHNDGWLSGVYYVKVPEFPKDVWERGEGCIQFGEPSTEFVTPRNQSHKLIRPEIGTAVFFPSYYWHGVRPFKQTGLRHAIAFDVI